MGVLEAITQINVSTAFAVAIIVSFSAIGTALSFGYLGAQYLTCITRNPEVANLLQGRFLIVAGFVEATSMIGIIVALLLAFSNPLLNPVNKVANSEQVVAEHVDAD